MVMTLATTREADVVKKPFGGKKAAPFTGAGRKKKYPRTAKGTQRRTP